MTKLILDTLQLCVTFQQLMKYCKFFEKISTFGQTVQISSYCSTFSFVSVDCHAALLFLAQIVQTLTGVSHPREGTGVRWGEHPLHTPWPQSLQWWIFRIGPNCSLHTEQCSISWSGTQYTGLLVSLSASKKYRNKPLITHQLFQHTETIG